MDKASEKVLPKISSTYGAYSKGKALTSQNNLLRNVQFGSSVPSIFTWRDLKRRDTDVIIAIALLSPLKHSLRGAMWASAVGRKFSLADIELYPCAIRRSVRAK